MPITVTNSGNFLEVNEGADQRTILLPKAEVTVWHDRANDDAVYLLTARSSIKILPSEFEPTVADGDALYTLLSEYSISESSGFVSELNSTTTLLTAGDIFPGEWEDASLFPSLTVAVKTDQNGTYTVQFSPDGVNIDSTLTRYYRTSIIEPPHRFTITRKYIRVTFTNTSASAQTYLRLQTMFGSMGDLNIPIDSTIAKDYDAIAVRPTKYEYETALGRRQGATTWNKWGYNNDIDIGTETVWSAGGTFVRINTPSTFTVVSSSANDVLTSGSGAWNIIIYYIDADRKAQTVIVPLNGVTPVVTAVTGLGINRCSVYNSGSSDVNEGTITITATTGGTTQAQMPAGEGVTQQAIFFTQADHQFLVDWLFININKTSGGGTPRVTVKAWVYSNVSTAKYLVFSDTIDSAVDNHISLNPSQPFIVGEKSILYFEATTDVNNTVVNIRFSGQEIADIDS